MLPARAAPHDLRLGEELTTRNVDAALQRTAAARSNTSFVDFRVDSPLAHDASDFLDPTHYRHTLADHMETRIIELLRAGETGAARADGAPLIAVTSRQGEKKP